MTPCDIKFEVRQIMYQNVNDLQRRRHFCFDANPYPTGRRGLRRNRNVWTAASSELSHFELECTCFSDKEPEIISCSYKYVANGKEKADGFQCTNGLSRGFWGDHIKSCKVRRLSGSGSFQLLINENGKPVFDSDMVETNDVIVYEKK